MPLTINDTTYAGNVASDFIVRAICGAETVNKGVAYVKDNIRKKFTIPRITVDNIVQARQETPTPQGDVIVDGQDLVPNDYMIYIEFNPRDFEDHWFSAQLDPKLLDRALPATVESALIQEVLKRHDEFHENAIWQSVDGSATPYTYYDGFIEKLDNSTDTIKIASPVALTSANILAKMFSIKATIPNPLKGNPKFKYLMSYADAEKFENAIQSLAANTDYASDVKKAFSGKDIIILAGMPENCIIGGVCAPDTSSNFWIGINSKYDQSEVTIARKQANSEIWFIKMLMQVDVQVGFPGEVVFYKA